MTAEFPPVYCTCGVLLSRNGITWGPGEGYRVSRRNSDGTPIRGIVTRPDTKGVEPLCRACVDAKVQQRRRAQTERLTPGAP